MTNIKARSHSKRIGVDIRPLMDTYYSGVPAYTYSLLKEIIRQDKDRQYVLFYNSARDVSARIPVFDEKNAEVIRTRYPNKVFNYLMQKTIRWPKLDRFLDVDLFFMPHINFAALSGGRSSVITVHDLSYLRFPEFFSIRKTVWHSAIGVKRILKRFDRIIAVSNNTKKDLIELVGLSEDRVKVIHSGLPDNYSYISPDNPELKEVKGKYGLPQKFILYLGTLEPRKNVKGVIDAFSECCRRGWLEHDHYLVLAGARGWKYQDIFRTWRESPFRNRIIFTGYVNEKDKAAFYNLASLFVYPSFYEGFGFPPLEAMLCGTPVITANTSSIPEVVGEGALLINPFDAGEIAVSINRVLKDSCLRKVLQEAGFQTSGKFSWQAAARECIDLFDEIIFK